MGFIKVANETMCRPIRALTQMKGCGIRLRSKYKNLSFKLSGQHEACEFRC